MGASGSCISNTLNAGFQANQARLRVPQKFDRLLRGKGNLRANISEFGLVASS
jgi:hypothetical protein